MLKLNEIYAKTYNFVYLRAKSVLKKEEDVLRLVKEVYLQAAAHIEELEEDSLYNWLGKQTYILGCNKYRKKKVREDDILELTEQDYTAKSPVDQEATREVLRESLEELPDMYQATLYAFYYDQMKCKEIAAVMGYGVGAVLHRMNYAHKYLSKSVENYREDTKVQAKFSIEALIEALREWSAANRLSVTVAQSVYVGICRELGAQSALHLEEDELAGANNRVAEYGADSKRMIFQELEDYSTKPAIGKRQIVLIVAAAAAFLAIVLAVALFTGKGSKEDGAQKEPDTTQQEQEKETDTDVDADANTDADADADGDANAGESTDANADEEADAGAGSESHDSGDEQISHDAEYLLPTSDTVKLTREDLRGFTKEDLRLARNELFARYGMIFGVTDLDNYFGSKSWYQPTVAYDDFYDTVEMNAIEEANLALILAVEEELAE